MARTFINSLSIACTSLLFCSFANGFQTHFDDERVTIATRVAAKSPLELPAAHLRVDMSLVLVPVHVTTRLGVSVTDLDKTNFQLFEDNVEQTITHFSKDDVPLSIGLVFDASASMHNKLHKSSEAAAAFFKTANREDEFFLVEFNERPHLAVPFTFDSDELYNHIVHTRTTGRTSLLDAIRMALLQMKNAKNTRKAIVIVSDGGDNCSRYTVGQIRNALVESDVQVYAMGIFDPLDSSKKRPPEEVKGPGLLSELAELSGGRHFPIGDLNELPEISERIGMELRNQYLLGYSPANLERDGKYRTIKLTLAPPAGMPALRTQYRHGYYAPAQ
ncbi:MAG TPA: VWA domain-containing protein [Bryobacteraceae bacterium]|jgi:Ca-activated chloride channel family protein|nr:VWA domain-containing protein [Bryobacteraceae bacterium]